MNLAFSCELHRQRSQGGPQRWMRRGLCRVRCRSRQEPGPPARHRELRPSRGGRRLRCDSLPCRGHRGSRGRQVDGLCHRTGGLGLDGVAIAAARGAIVYSVDISEAKLGPARHAGAIECATSLDHSSDKTFDVILDFAGAQATVGGVVCREAGRNCVLVGLAASTVEITTIEIVMNNISLKGSTSASIDELRHLLDMVAAGKLTPQIEAVPFEDVPISLKRLGSGEVMGQLYTVPYTTCQCR